MFFFLCTPHPTPIVVNNFFSFYLWWIFNCPSVDKAPSLYKAFNTYFEHHHRIHTLNIIIARNPGHLSPRIRQQFFSKMFECFNMASSRRSHVVDYKQLNSLSSVVMYDTAPHPKKRGKLFEVERIITR